jgi:hypothetical protein
MKIVLDLEKRIIIYSKDNRIYKILAKLKKGQVARRCSKYGLLITNGNKTALRYNLKPHPYIIKEDDYRQRH